MRILLLSSMAFAAFCLPATADERNNLTGLRRFELVIEPPPSAAIRCGITRETLDKRVREALRSSKLVLVNPDESADAQLEIALNAIEGCFVNVTVEVATFVRIRKSDRSTMATVWRVAAMGGQYGFQQNFDGLVRQFAQDWALANRDRQ